VLPEKIDQGNHSPSTQLSMARRKKHVGFESGFWVSKIAVFFQQKWDGPKNNMNVYILGKATIKVGLVDFYFESINICYSISSGVLNVKDQVPSLLLVGLK